MRNSCIVETLKLYRRLYKIFNVKVKVFCYVNYLIYDLNNVLVTRMLFVKQDAAGYAAGYETCAFCDRYYTILRVDR